MKLKIFLTLSIILFLGSAGLFYVNKVLLPVQVKGMVVKAIEEQTGRKASLASLQWGPIKGLAISELVIYDKERPSEIFLHIQNGSAQILLMPFLSKKVIIPSLRIDGLSLAVTKTGRDTWNFSDLIKPATDTSSASGTPDIVISGFTLAQARLVLADRSSGEEFADTISPITIKGSFSLAAGLHISGELAVPATSGTLKFDTRTGLRDKTFKGDFKIANLNLTRYLRFSPDVLPVTLKEATLKAGDIAVQADNKNITVSVTAAMPGLSLLPQDTTRLTTDLLLTKCILSINNNIFSLQGDITANKTEAAQGNNLFTGDLSANIAALSIHNGELSLTGTLESRNTAVVLDGGAKAQGHLTLTSLKASQKNKDLSASADVQIKDLLLETPQGQKVSGDLTLSKADVKMTGPRTDVRTSLKFSRLRAKNGDMLLTTDLIAPDLVIVNDEALDIQLTAKLNTAEISLPQKINFSGNPAASVHLHKGQGTFFYDGTLDLVDGLIKGLPLVESAKDIQGKILFETDTLSTKDLSFKVLDTAVSVTGTLKDFENSNLKIEASAPAVNLALAERIMPQVFKDSGLSVAGTADITARIEGPAKNINASSITASAAISSASVDSTKLRRTLKNISGMLSYTAPSLSWKNLSVDFEKRTYVLNGYLQDFLNPYVTTSLKGEDLSLDIQAQKTGDAIQIQNLAASIFSSSVTAKGKISLPPGKDPVIDIVSDGKIVISDIPRLLPQYEKDIASLKLEGTLKVAADIKGIAADWQHWNADVSITTPALSIMGYKINNLAITALEKDGLLQPLEIKGLLYGGELAVISSLGLADTGLPFDTTFKLTRTNLELLKQDIAALQQKQFSGSLTIAGTLKGKAADWKNMNGHSTVQISEGYLWEFPILTKILGILSTSFQGGDVIITDASATLKFSEGRIATNNLNLQSSAVSLIGEGWLDYDQNVDLNITPRADPTGSTTLGLINPTEGLINFHVTGSIQKPKIEHNLSAPTVIKKTLQNTVGNLLKIFE